MVTEKQKLKAEYIILFLACALNISILLFRIFRGDMEFQDFHARWQECAYLLRGINPFTALNGEVTIDFIGEIDPDMVTVPWAWIWGNIINPGFLPYAFAKLWGMFFYMVTVSVTSIMSAKYIGSKVNVCHARYWLIAIGAVIIAQYNLIWSFMCGNHGALACCFVIQAIIIIDDHPYVAAFLLVLALIKPQVTLPFLFVLLLLHRYRTLLTTFVLELATIIVLCLITHLGMLELLMGTASVGTNLGGVYFGLFNLLKYAGFSTNIILVMDMFAGIVLVIWLFKQTIRNKGYRFFSFEEFKVTNLMEVFVPCAIASTFWFYKQPHDMVILAIPLLVSIYRVITMEDKKSVVIMLIIQTIIIYVFYGQSIVRKVVVMLIPSINEYFSKELFMNITSLVLIAVCILMESNTLSYEGMEKNV